MSDPTPPVPPDAIENALHAGNKIEAIKLHRQQTGMGLAESKAAVEKLEAQLRASSPERFSKPQKSGCTTMILAVLVVAGLMCLWVFR